MIMKEELEHYNLFDELDMSDIRYYLFTRKDIAQKRLETKDKALQKEIDTTIEYMNSRLKEIIFYDEV